MQRWDAGLVVGMTLLMSGAAGAQSVAPTRAGAPPPLVAGEPSAELTRRVTYRQQTVIPLSTATRFTTLLILPADEQVMDILCGDKDFWQTAAQGHFVFIKPAKAGARTNLNVLTAAGRVYSFLLQEGAGDVPDLKVYIELDEEEARLRAGAARWVPASDVEMWKRETERARRDAEEAVAALTVSYPRTLRFDFDYQRNDRPFYIDAIWHDGKNTYIRARTRELPSLYEMQDGKPSLIQFTAHEQLYVVPKVLTEGYLSLGKRKTTFRRVR